MSFQSDSYDRDDYHPNYRQEISGRSDESLWSSFKYDRICVEEEIDLVLHKIVDDNELAILARVLISTGFVLLDRYPELSPNELEIFLDLTGI